MSEDIDFIVKRIFPENLVTYSNFEDWCSDLRNEILPKAVDFINELRDQYTILQNTCLIQCHQRNNCCDFFGGDGDKLLKSISSIRSKLVRDFDEQEKVPKNSNYLIPIARVDETKLRENILQFGDLGRVRIVADFPSDVQCLLSKLFINRKLLGEYNCPKGIKDFVYDPQKRDGLKGHRARQFSIRINFNGNESFGFEIQLMTRLQHAWDRRNHPLYEWQRESLGDWLNQQEIVELVVNDFACAETLHLVDLQADQNWKTLQRLMKDKGNNHE